MRLVDVELLGRKILSEEGSLEVRNVGLIFFKFNSCLLKKLI